MTGGSSHLCGAAPGMGGGLTLLQQVHLHIFTREGLGEGFSGTEDVTERRKRSMKREKRKVKSKSRTVNVERLV